MNIDHLQSETIQRIEHACRAGLKPDACVDNMAQAAGWSTGYFQRQFRQMLGITPGEFLRSGRLQRFGELLRQNHTVTQALYEAGYGSSSRSHQATDEGLGMSPAQVRRGGHGVRVQYALTDCSLGRVLVAATERGLCAILLGQKDQLLIADLRHRLPRAELNQAGAEFQNTLNQVIGILDQTLPVPSEMDLDLIGTAFQRRVWQALQQIPSGRTITYAELARAIGQPNSHRAVAGACGANPLAVVVPCHRIVRSDGGLGGYRWGLEIKQQLIQREAKAAQA
ncbi:MAG: methylated-DNA--[protein]-cysteine S-methyltransferase [Pseudomonadota bacterium]